MIASHGAGRNALETAERFADGKATRQEVEQAGRVGFDVPVWQAARTPEEHAWYVVVYGACGLNVRGTAEGLGQSLAVASQMSNAPAAQADVLRCIVGNPFRQVCYEPAWRTETAVGLAEAIYAGRAFDRLPVLADALEEAGCDNADLLAHCRGDGPHARGCWVVDVVLGKV